MRGDTGGGNAAVNRANSGGWQTESWNGGDDWYGDKGWKGKGKGYKGKGKGKGTLTLFCFQLDLRLGVICSILGDDLNASFCLPTSAYFGKERLFAVAHADPPL